MSPAQTEPMSKTDLAWLKSGNIINNQRLVAYEKMEQLERELNEAKDRIETQVNLYLSVDKYSIEVSEERDQWKAMAQELAGELEKARRRYRMMMAIKIEELQTLPTPHDAALSRFNELNK